MATARPVITVYKADDASSKNQVPMPDVFQAPLRADQVDFVHKLMLKNTRQAYAVSENAGYQTAAESWGTGRAVARIPRVPGGGTHRAGQGAFGNMCRGGSMFCPTKIWRRWHRKINITQKRHAVSATLASSAVGPLVMARGHRIEDVPELPLVVDDSLEKMTKTKDVYNLCKRFGLKADLDRVLANRKIRAGKGKARGKKYKTPRGPLIVYNSDDGIVKAAKNIPGLDVVNVNSPNLLKLAPGGKLGRMCIWTESAIAACEDNFGTMTNAAKNKKGYHIGRPVMTNCDLSKIINSEEIQAVLRPAREGMSKACRQKKNPLKSMDALNKINPGASKRAMRARATNEATKPAGKRASKFETTDEYNSAKLQKKKNLTKKKANSKVAKAWYKEQMDAYKVVKPVEGDDDEEDEE
jgi:large subunit ribosomal protein L4e